MEALRKRVKVVEDDLLKECRRYDLFSEVAVVVLAVKVLNGVLDRLQVEVDYIAE